MRRLNVLVVAVGSFIAAGSLSLSFPPPQQEDPLKVLADRLDIENYKATIKGLTEFGDRQAGTDRNRKAVDWIKAQLESYRCFTDRLTYPYRSSPSALQEIRDQVFCTKIGTTGSEEMYIVGAHMDGQGGGEAADDNASGTALVMELARIFSMPDVQTERSIRFVFWNNQETGYQGANAYIDQRRDMQGKEDYPGSGNYPEARWLALIDLDTVLWDRTTPRTGADVNIEFPSSGRFAEQSRKLAELFKEANGKYAAGYRATIREYTSGVEPPPFSDLIPWIRLREPSTPHARQSTDVFATYNDDDFRLGLNAAQTTLAAVGQLAGTRLKK